MKNLYELAAVRDNELVTAGQEVSVSKCLEMGHRGGLPIHFRPCIKRGIDRYACCRHVTCRRCFTCELEARVTLYNSYLSGVIPLDKALLCIGVRTYKITLLIAARWEFDARADTSPDKAYIRYLSTCATHSNWFPRLFPHTTGEKYNFRQQFCYYVTVQ